MCTRVFVMLSLFVCCISCNVFTDYYKLADSDVEYIDPLVDKSISYYHNGEPALTIEYNSKYTLEKHGVDNQYIKGTNHYFDKLVLNGTITYADTTKPNGEVEIVLSAFDNERSFKYLLDYRENGAGFDENLKDKRYHTQYESLEYQGQALTNVISFRSFTTYCSNPCDHQVRWDSILINKEHGIAAFTFQGEIYTVY